MGVAQKKIVAHGATDDEVDTVNTTDLEAQHAKVCEIGISMTGIVVAEIGTSTETADTITIMTGTREVIGSKVVRRGQTDGTVVEADVVAIVHRREEIIIMTDINDNKG